MSGQLENIFQLLSGFTTEAADDGILIKIEKDTFIKKMLTIMGLYNMGFEHYIDDKYIIIKIPIQVYGKEALKSLGVLQ